MLYYNPSDTRPEKDDFSEVDYRNKKEEVLSKFRKEFIKGTYLFDAELHAIVELLIRDVDPYTIIEELIISRIKLDAKILKMMQEWELPQTKKDLYREKDGN